MISRLMSALRMEFQRLLQRLGFSRSGGWRTILVHIAIVIAFGIFLPWRQGLNFLDAFLIIAYACLSILFAAPATAQAMQAEGAPASMAVLAGRVLVAVFYGWVMSVLLIGAGLATINLTFRAGEFLHPGWGLLSSAVAFGFGASLFTSALAALVSLLFSGTAARMMVRILFLGVLCLIVFRGVILPASVVEWFALQSTTAGLTRLAWIGAAFFFVLGVALLITMRGWFVPRAREIDD